MYSVWSTARRALCGLFLVAVGVVVGISSGGRAGHEAAIYPSYYPQEIRIDVVPSDTAQDALKRGDIHAHLGAAGAWAEEANSTIAFAESLGSYVLLAQDGEADCQRSDRVLGALAKVASGLVFHPYPVTDYHADYLHHFDRAAALKERALRSAAASETPLLTGADQATRAWIGRFWPENADGKSVTIKLVPVEALLSRHGYHLNGWTGPPWLKAGWFHAYLLLRDGISDPQSKRRIDDLIDRLKSDEFSTDAARINAERALVSALTAECRLVVAGYVKRRQAYNIDYSVGIENVAYDSLSGFNSAIFLRTVKLKDFPWNGWLRLGLSERPEAAWNPIAGFTDGFGRLIWHGVGDPALLAEPYGATWFGNRIADIEINPSQ